MIERVEIYDISNPSGRSCLISILKAHGDYESKSFHIDFRILHSFLSLSTSKRLHLATQAMGQNFRTLLVNWSIIFADEEVIDFFFNNDSHESVHKFWILKMETYQGVIRREQWSLNKANICSTQWILFLFSSQGTSVQV